MQTQSKYSVGLKYGITAAVICCILLFIRFKYFATDPLSFGGFAAISYLFFLVLFYFTGVARRKQLGGYAGFKEIFQSVLLVIVITELSYAVFNFVYLKYLEPGFFDRFYNTSIANFKKAGFSDDKIEMQMKNLKNIFPMLSADHALQGTGMWVVIDCIFGLIFSFALKKNKQNFQEKI